jgi:hypothetical protein
VSSRCGLRDAFGAPRDWWGRARSRCGVHFRTCGRSLSRNTTSIAVDVSKGCMNARYNPEGSCIPILQVHKQGSDKVGNNQKGSPSSMQGTLSVSSREGTTEIKYGRQSRDPGSLNRLLSRIPSPSYIMHPTWPAQVLFSCNTAQHSSRSLPTFYHCCFSSVTVPDVVDIFYIGQVAQQGKSSLQDAQSFWLGGGNCLIQAVVLPWHR